MTDCARCMEQCGECCCLARSSVQDAPAEATRYDLVRRPIAEIAWTVSEIKAPTQEQTDAMLAILRGER